MALVQRLSEEDLMLLEIVEDEIWLGEWLRSTADGSPVKEEHPKHKFSYRWYQRDLLTDKSPHIVLRGGRAIGKCNPQSSRIYTTEGYKTIQNLLRTKRGRFDVYAYDEKENRLVIKRARLDKDAWKSVYTLTTRSGYKFDATANHPVFTQRGWIPLEQLDIEHDQVAVMTSVPWNSIQNSFSWYELRWLGYIFSCNRQLRGEMYIPVRFQKQNVELQLIAKNFGVKCVVSQIGTCLIHSDRTMGPHRGKMLLDESDSERELYGRHPSRVPSRVMNERIENLKIFLEAFLSMTVEECTPERAVFKNYFLGVMEDVQELLLRFGVETRLDITPLPEHPVKTMRGKKENQKGYEYRLITTTQMAINNFLRTFTLPGINFPEVRTMTDKVENSYFRFEPISEIRIRGKEVTWSLHVYDTHNYICDNLLVHNSLFFEDKIIYETINHDLMFPETKEQTLATANVAQMTPILDRLINRFMTSQFLKSFAPSPNRSKGTIDFPIGNRIYRINARIAGSKGDTNMVGLHVNKIKVDEAQLFPWDAYVQMIPTLNQWEERTQMLFTGVPNGVSHGSVLWFLDQKSSKTKKYRVPAHENPFFSYRDNEEAKRQYGGEDSDDYIRLVVGGHGNPTINPIPRDVMKFQPFDFFSYRYSAADKNAGGTFEDKFRIPEIPKEYMKHVVFAIDTGFADPTIVQVIGADDNMIWRTLARYRMTRIPFPEQSYIIDWLDSHYHPTAIGIDFGAGGGGIGIAQDLQDTVKYPKWKRYAKGIHGIRFGDTISVGEDPHGQPMKYILKAWAGEQLAKIVAEHELIQSEIDQEGASQLERVSAVRRPDGSLRFFVASEKGHGEAQDDHIFASYIVFVAMLSSIEMSKTRIKKLFSARWSS